MSEFCTPLSVDLAYLATLDRESLVTIAAMRGQLLGQFREERHLIRQSVGKSLWFDETPLFRQAVADALREEQP